MSEISYQSNLVKIVQLPVIEQHLPAIKEQIEKMTSEALSLACTEETLASVKEARASLNKSKKYFDDVRKQIEGEILKPLERFRKVFKENITVTFAIADRELKEKIDTIETEQKLEKENEVREYYDEYAKSIGIDFAPYERAGINITKSASMKSLKKQAKDFLDGIMQDLRLIATQEHVPEILVEYRYSLNASQSIETVLNRHKAIEEIENQKEEKEAEVEKQAEAVKKVEETLDEEPVITKTFKITATFSQFLELTEYLERNEIKYE